MRRVVLIPVLCILIALVIGSTLMIDHVLAPLGHEVVLQHADFNSAP